MSSNLANAEAEVEVASGMPIGQEVPLSLSRQLHDATQPLTVLQGLLELALIKSQTVEDYRQSVELALKESARVAICFVELRDLITLHQRQTQYPSPGVNLV